MQWPQLETILRQWKEYSKSAKVSISSLLERLIWLHGNAESHVQRSWDMLECPTRYDYTVPGLKITRSHWITRSPIKLCPKSQVKRSQEVLGQLRTSGIDMITKVSGPKVPRSFGTTETSWDMSYQPWLTKSNIQRSQARSKLGISWDIPGHPWMSMTTKVPIRTSPARSLWTTQGMSYQTWLP